MTCRILLLFILLLFILTSCVCGSFVVNVTQSSYQAEENHNITLEWTFTTNTDRSTNSLNVLCQLLTDIRPSVLFHLHEGVEVSESQDEQFAGRVQCDKDVLREGRLRLHVSRLRTADSGLYMCDLLTSYGTNSGECRLNVTAAADEPKPQRPTVRPQAESRGRIGLYVGLTAALLAFLALLVYFSILRRKSTDKRGNLSAVVLELNFPEKQAIRTNRSLSRGPPLNKSSLIQDLSHKTRDFQTLVLQHLV